MKVIGRLLALIFLAGLLLLLNERPYIGTVPKDLNVILLTVDSLRPDHLGCYGYKKPISPNIDALAEKGVLFRRAYSTSAWTLPGLMSILTSLPPSVHGLDRRGATLNPQIITIFDCFADAGYRLPNICFILSLPECSTIRIEPVERQYFSEEDSEELFRWLDENHDMKFFLWYHYRNLHLPYRPREASHSLFLARKPDEQRLSPGIRAVLSDSASVLATSVKFDPAERPIIEDLYDGEVKELDAFVGRLQARLLKYGINEKTLLVITADHGEELLDHGFVGHASTAGTSNLCDEVIRIPLIISLPQYLPGASRIREQVQQIDIMPTILKIAGVPIPPGLQGRSLVPLIRDAAKRSESSAPVFVETICGGYQATEEMSKTWARCVRTDSWKLIETEGPQEKKYQLFDLSTDPKEQRDVYAENREAADVLQTLLEEWQRGNSIRRNATFSLGSEFSLGSGEKTCPQFIFPYNEAPLSFIQRHGIISASWTGDPLSTYVIEYEIGSGLHRLTGSFLVSGNQRDFGPYSRELWSALVARNPWRVRISPDAQPRCWSEWIEFTFRE